MRGKLYYNITCGNVRSLSLPCDWFRFAAELSVYAYTCLTRVWWCCQ